MPHIGPSATDRGAAVRWLQLVAGIIWMVMIANLQYGWTLFVTPIDEKYHWGRAAIQVAFTIFVLTETVAAITAIADLKPLRAAHDSGAGDMRPARVQHP